MKILKKRIIIYVIMALAGITLFFLNIYQNMNNSTIMGIASGLTVISIIKLIQFYRIFKNPKLLKKYEIEQKEERFILIAEKSGRFSFILTLITEFASMFILIVLHQDMVATIVSYIIGIQTLAYLITYYYLSKKY